MAPVGRWQKNKDLSWYAKGDKSDAATAAAEARKEEIRRIKQAESDALSRALGYEPVDRGESNANNTPIGKNDVARAIKDTAEGEDDAGVKGVGFGGFMSAGGFKEESRETLDGYGLDGDEREPERPQARAGDRKHHRRERSHGRDRSRDRRHRRHTHDHGKSHQRDRSKDWDRYRSRSRSRDRHRHQRRRSRSCERTRDDDRSYRRHRDRSYSPDPPKRRDYSRDRLRL